MTAQNDGGRPGKGSALFGWLKNLMARASRRANDYMIEGRAPRVSVFERSMSQFKARTIPSLDTVAADAWDACANPPASVEPTRTGSGTILL